MNEELIITPETVEQAAIWHKHRLKTNIRYKG